MEGFNVDLYTGNNDEQGAGQITVTLTGATSLDFFIPYTAGGGWLQPNIDYSTNE